MIEHNIMIILMSIHGVGCCVDIAYGSVWENARGFYQIKTLILKNFYFHQPHFKSSGINNIIPILIYHPSLTKSKKRQITLPLPGPQV